MTAAPYGLSCSASAAAWAGSSPEILSWRELVPEFAAIAPYLPTHWWNSFDALLRTPMDTTALWHGLLSFAVYAVIFGCIAWAKFTASDVTS